MRAPSVVVLASLGVMASTGLAAAEVAPVARFGLTFAVANERAPEQHELGPMVALGARLGPVTLETDYAYLSFMEPDVSDGGMHRLGLNLRGDLYRSTNRPCVRILPCTRAFALYAELGIAMRYGQWHIDATTRSPAATARQREGHAALGVELNNRLEPYRHGWQFGVRLAAAPRDDLMVACRGTTCRSTAGATGGGETDLTVLVEWTFLVGR